VNIYYWTGDPLEVNAVEALQYLQNNPGVTGSYLLNNVNIIPFDNAQQLNQNLREIIAGGARTAITTTGTPLLQSTFDTLILYPNFQLLNLFSTADTIKPPNVIRFALPDTTTFPFVLVSILPDTVILYDPDNTWATDSAIYFSFRGFTTYKYEGPDTFVPPSVPVMIIANTRTPELIDAVPLSCPKLYGLDGSAFFPLTGLTRAKAIEKQFECFTYWPEVTSPIIADVETAINKQVNYIFPTALDAVKYAQNYLNGLSNNTIQTTTTGFTGSLVMQANNRRYGNVAIYQLGLERWSLNRTFVITNEGVCSISTQ
jgi:hypothetical protein